MFADLPDFMTVKQVAAALQVTPRHVYELLRQGAIRGFKTGSDWRVTKEALIAYAMRDESR